MFLELSPILASGNTGELFRLVLPFALVGIFVIMGLHFGVSMIYRGGSVESARWNLWDILIYLGTLGCVAVLGVTSFVAVMMHGALGGWPLFFHMFGAGALTAVLPILALSWGYSNRLELGVPTGNVAPPKFDCFSKLMYWTILVGGLVVTMTMLISMLPVFGSDGLLKLLDIHRYSGLVVVMAMALHLYGVVTHRLGLR